MATRRRYVHVFATFGAGGPQVRATQLFAALGPEVEHVVVAMDGRTDAMAMVPAGIEVMLAPPPPRGGLLRTVRALRRQLLAARPALVLTYNWGAIEAVLAARCARLPLVHHEDGFGPEEVERRLRRRSWLRAVALRGVPVLVPSLVLQRIAAREWHLAPARVLHAPNGVDLVRFQPRPAAVGAPFVVGTVGGLRPEKDQHTLLRAFAALGPGDVICRLVGGGALLASLQQEARALGIADRVQFVGPVADTAPVYAGFDVFVLSSCTEQMPLVLVEAMASGLPVVATDVGDVRATLPPSAAPYVVPPRDPAALARALAAMLASAPARAAAGAANRARAAAAYAAGVCSARFLDVYRARERG
jgi:glycosyltransferase involved in cell wall biosynthesis